MGERVVICYLISEIQDKAVSPHLSLHLSSVFDLCTMRIHICVPYLPLRVREEGRALPFKNQRLILLVVIVTDLMMHMELNQYL